MATEAEGLIGQLLAQGWSRNQIAGVVGRDVSLISQAARGKKPVTNLLPALHRLVSTHQGPQVAANIGSINVARRAQRVRQAAERIGAAPAPAQQALHVTSGGNVTIKKTLEQAAREGKRVQLTGTFDNVKRRHKSPTVGQKAGRGRAKAGKGRREKQAEVPMFQKGGWDADKLLDRIEHPQPGDTWKPGDARGAIKVLAQREGIIERVGSFRRVEIHGYNPV